MRERPIVLLASPYGQTGGGMGSIMTYLASMPDGPATDYHFERVETRGGGHVLLSPLYVVLAAGRIVTSRLRSGPVLLHLNLAEGGSVYRKGFLLAVAKATGCPVLLHLHAARIRQFHQSVNGIGKWLLRWMFQTADRTVVLGNVWRRWVIENFAVEARRISVVYNGVPSSTQKLHSQSDSSDFHLLFVGNLSERKGVSDLLSAMAMPSLRQRKIGLTLAGGGPVEHYRRISEQLGIADRVSFKGWLDQGAIQPLIASADALILPSYDEGLPLVILEALASGTPVICTPVGSVPEVLEDRTNAVFVTPGAVSEIAEAVAQLADDHALGTALASAGHELYTRTFTLEAFARAITDIYATMLTDKAPSLNRWSKMQEAGSDGGG